jgi:hypothetical protein
MTEQTHTEMEILETTNGSLIRYTQNDGSHQSLFIPGSCGERGNLLPNQEGIAIMQKYLETVRIIKIKQNRT